MADETKIPGADETPASEAHTHETPGPLPGRSIPLLKRSTALPRRGMRSRVSFRAWETILPPRVRLSI